MKKSPKRLLKLPPPSEARNFLKRLALNEFLKSARVCRALFFGAFLRAVSDALFRSFFPALRSFGRTFPASLSETSFCQTFSSAFSGVLFPTLFFRQLFRAVFTNAFYAPFCSRSFFGAFSAFLRYFFPARPICAAHIFRLRRISCKKSANAKFIPHFRLQFDGKCYIMKGNQSVKSGYSL